MLLALSALLLVTRPARAEPSCPVHERRLPNGLRAIVCADPAAPDVSLLVRYDAGARDEPTYLEGLAHLVEHVMFMGSKHVPRGRLAALYEQAGASNVNGVTSADATIFHVTLPPERIELGLWLESDRMGYLLDTLDEDVFRRARAEVINEHRGSVLDRPLGAVPHLLFAELFPAWHPYHHLPIGSERSLERTITLADVRAFAGTWYGPANATVVITGQADPEAALRLVDRYFGALPARTPPARPPLPALSRRVTTELEVVGGVTRAQVIFAWVTPAHGAPHDAALDVAATILTGRGAGRLHHALMERSPRLAVEVSASQESRALASTFAVRATVADPHAMGPVVAEIRRAVGALAAGPSEEEIVRARRILRTSVLFSLESSLSWASRLASAAARGPLPRRFDADLDRWTRVTAADVRAAAQASLAGKPGVTVIARPARGAPLIGRLLGTREVAP